MDQPIQLSQSHQAEVQTYDLFVSYAEENAAWVEGYLLEALKAAEVRVLTKAAFHLDVPRLQEFERAIKQSKRIVLVISSAYLNSGFNSFFDLLAQSYGTETGTWPVIPLLLEQVMVPTRLSMLNSLNATKQEDWEIAIERLCRELEIPLPGPTPKPHCPYPGMRPFDQDQSKYFFGRQQEVDEMLNRLRHQHFLFVIGPSGSGKSSLVFAGLVPKLLQQQKKWNIQHLRPANTSVEKQAEVLNWLIPGPVTGLALDERSSPLPDASQDLLIIDQFEELFTTYTKEEQRQFIALLKNLRSGSCSIVLTMRADYYPDLMNSDFWPLTPGERIEVAPLRGEALKAAITQPAKEEKVHMEVSLVEGIIAEAANEPGVLPLVQETMQLLWERTEHHFISLSP